MKKITFLCIAVLTACLVNAQATIVYHEDFEIADSVTASGSPVWGPDLTCHTNGLAGYKNQVGTSPNYLTTNTFSTVGNFFILFDFDGICKIKYHASGVVQVSTDNGNTWVTLT